MTPPLRPVRVAAFPSGDLGIVWSDGHESWYVGHSLRCSCSCAHCVDELTGEKTLLDERVPRDVAPKGIQPVGNYGLSVAWSDGHDTGIYTFERLRALCGCDACSGSTAD